MSIAELGTGRFGQLITRLLGIPGQPPVTEVGGSLDVGLTLETDRVEWSYLKGELIVGWVDTVAAVALQNAIARIRNPADSNTLIVIERVIVSSTVATPFFSAETNDATTDLTTLRATGIAQDSRWRASNLAAVRGSAVTSIGNNVALSTPSPFTFAGTAQTPYVMSDVNVILGPGSFFQFANNFPAGDLYFAARWRQRQLTAPYEA